MRFLEQKTPSAVILDLGLPWLDGFGVLSVMRQQPSTVRVPVVVITGTDAAEVEVRRFAPVRLMRKPFEAEQLLQSINDVLRERKG